MEIIFQSTSRAKGHKARGKGKVVYDLSNYKPIIFNGGIYRTTSKEEVQRILHSRLFEDETIQNVTDMEIIDKYLRGDEPDKLSEELLNTIDDEGLRKICKFSGIPENRHKNYGGVMRAMLEGKPVTNMVHQVIQNHTMDSPEEDLMGQAEEAGLIYRSGPWYKYRKGEEQVSDQDLSLGRTEAEAQEWIAKNKQELKDRLN